MSPYPDRRLRLLLLFGGQSAEHDVSRVSAVAVASALDPVTAFFDGCTRDGLVIAGFERGTGWPCQKADDDGKRC